MHKLYYKPDNSLIHRLYPLTKFIWMILGTLLVFLLTESLLLAFIAALSFLILLVIKPDIWKVRGFRFVLITGLFLLILYVLFEKTGQILWDPGMDLLLITAGGLDMGLRFSSRFLSIVFLSYIFILTTSPNDLAYSLMKLGVPYRYGFMLVTALRLSPILEEEGQIIYKAQLVRGIRYDKSGFKRLILLVQQFLTPLLISAIRKTDKLVFSMEGRGFGKTPKRTFQSRSRPSKLDAVTSILLFILCCSLIVLNYGGKL